MLKAFGRGKPKPNRVEKSETTKLYEKLYDAQVARFERQLEHDKSKEIVGWNRLRSLAKPKLFSIFTAKVWKNDFDLANGLIILGHSLSH